MTAPDLWALYQRADAALARAGFAPTPKLWAETIKRFYRHPTARTLIAQVGRGGAKSTHAVKMGVVETVFGDWAVPPGERHFFVFVSENVSEAANRLRLIEAYLDALAVPFTRAGDVIELTGTRLGFRVLACRVGAVSGFRCIGWSADELAKWSVDGTNPSAEILASVRAMTVTHRGARGRGISTPLGRLGTFNELVERGDTDDQIVFCAASWEANPDAITEEQTHKLEPHEPTWRREYAAIPSGTHSAAFDADAIDRAFESRGRLERVAAPVICTDPAGRGSDSWGYLSACWVIPEPHELDMYEGEYCTDTNIPGVYMLKRDLAGRPIKRKDFVAPKRLLLIESMGVISADYRSRVTAEDVYRTIAETGARLGAGIVASDQFDSYSGGAWLKKFGMTARSYPWTATSKQKAVSRLRDYLHGERIVIAQEVHAPQLRRELLAYEERITGNGITYGGRDASGGHLDLVSCLLTMCMADEAGDLEGAPANGRVSNALFSFGSGGFRSSA